MPAFFREYEEFRGTGERNEQGETLAQLSCLKPSGAGKAPATHFKGRGDFGHTR